MKIACAVLSLTGLVGCDKTPPAAVLDLPEPLLDGVDPAVVRAIEKTTAAVHKSPTAARPWGRLGMTLLAHDFSADARPCFRRAAELDPDDPRWPYLDAWTRVTTDPEAAVSGLERAVELCDDRPPAPRLKLAEVLFELGRVDDATSHFRRVLRSDADHPRAHLGLARAALQSGELEASLAHLERVEMAPRARGAATLLLAQVHARLGHAELARQKRAEAAGSSEPRWLDPYYRQVTSLRRGKKTALVQADILIGKGRHEEAVRVLERLTREYPDSLWAWILMGRAQLKLQQLDEAEDALQRALRLKPDSVEARFRLGVSLLHRKRYEDAAGCFHKAISGKPDFARAYFNLGYCLTQTNRLEPAIAAFRAAIRYEPGNADGLGYLGHLLARTGELEEAETYLRAAAELDPGSAWIRQKLAEVEARLDADR